MRLYKSSGPLRYSYNEDYGYRLVLDVDPGVVALSRYLVPKAFKLNPQKYKPHISIVRKEVPGKLEFWGLYESELVEFEYTNIIYSGTVYWWLNAFSKRLEEIRLELGLPVHSLYTVPPEGYLKCYHITIGNIKI